MTLEWMTVEEAAAYMRVGVATVYQWSEAGLLPHHELVTGGGQRYRREDLDKLLQERPRGGEAHEGPWRPGQGPQEARRADDPAAMSVPSSGATMPRAMHTPDGRPVLVSAIIPHPRGRPEVLMTQRVQHRVWSWVGGHVLNGEAPADAVIRELNEELRVDGARVVRALDTVDFHADGPEWWGERFRRGYRGYQLEVAIASPDLEIIDHEEIADVRWVPFDSLREAVAYLPSELAGAAVKATVTVLGTAVPTRAEKPPQEAP